MYAAVTSGFCALIFVVTVMVVMVNRGLFLLLVVAWRSGLGRGRDVVKELPQSHCSLFFLLFPLQHSPRLFLLPQSEFTQTLHGDGFGQVFLDKTSVRDPVTAIVDGLVDVIAVVESRWVGLELVVPLLSLGGAFGAHDETQRRFFEQFPRALVRLVDGNHGVGHALRVVLEVAKHFDSSELLHQPNNLATLGQCLYTRVQPQMHCAVPNGPNEPRECHVCC